MHIFNNRIIARVRDRELTGVWQKLDYYEEGNFYSIPFRAFWGDTSRFKELQRTKYTESINGKWDAVFLQR